jgi:hypothetical protein
MSAKIFQGFSNKLKDVNTNMLYGFGYFSVVGSMFYITMTKEKPSSPPKIAPTGEIKYHSHYTHPLHPCHWSHPNNKFTDVASDTKSDP